MFSQSVTTGSAIELWRLFSQKYEALEQTIASKVLHVLTVPVDLETRSQLKEVLAKGDWNHSIFSHENTPYAALSLYQAQEITYHQLCTLLERRQILEDFPLINTYPILDENNEFTQEARQFLLAALYQSNQLKNLTSEQEYQLKKLVAALPLSERYFYTTSIGKFNDKDDNSLGKSIIESGDVCALIKDTCAQQLVHTSTGFFDAFGLTKFGLNEYTRPLYQLGVQGIDDIEKGVKSFVRFAALNFPGTASYKGNIHNYDKLTFLEVTAHDKYHAMLMSAVPKPIVHAFWHIIDVLRNTTGNKWSKEIWTFVDCEIIFCISHYMSRSLNKLSDKEMTDLFCNGIRLANGEISEKYCSLVLKNEITPAFISIILDMHKHPEIWAEYQINPLYFTDKFREYYDTLGEIYSFIKDDDSSLQVFKCQLYFTHKFFDNENVINFNELLDVMNQNKETFWNQVALKKVTLKDIKNKDFLPFKINTMYLSYAGEKTPEKIYRSLVNYFVQNDLIFPKKKAVKPSYEKYNNLLWQPRPDTKNKNTVFTSLRKQY